VRSYKIQLPDIESYLEYTNRWNPKVHALLDWDEFGVRQRSASARADQALAGWPMAVKDIIDVAGMPTRCNADFLPDGPATQDAVIVDRLRAQGAFVSAKSVTTAFAYLDPGPTRNPWNLAHTPGGSSSGSAAAVACGMVRLALGSQTVASVNRPASYCGVVGFKPTFGRWSTDGVFAFSPSVDTVGIFTAGVDDAEVVYCALEAQPPVPSPDILRVGWVSDHGGPPPESSMQAVVASACRRLEAAGHHVMPMPVPSWVQQAHVHHRNLIAMEVAQVHHNLFAHCGDQYPSKLRALIERGRSVAAHEADEIGPHRQQTIEWLDACFNEVDVLLSASAPGPAPVGIDATGDPRMSLLWTYTGGPTLTIPVQLSASGLPLALQLVGRRGDDQRLLAIGRVVETVFDFIGLPFGTGTCTDRPGSSSNKSSAESTIVDSISPNGF